MTAYRFAAASGSQRAVLFSTERNVRNAMSADAQMLKEKCAM